MDTEKLMKSLEYDVHEDILNTTSSLIAKEKNDILQSMQFNRTQLKEYHKKLKNYRFVDEINQLKYGNYLRWFNIRDPDNIKLTNGAFFSEFKLLSSGCQLLLKTNTNKLIQIKMDECIIFQKLSDQEQIILSAVNHLNSR